MLAKIFEPGYLRKLTDKSWTIFGLLIVLSLLFSSCSGLSTKSTSQKSVPQDHNKVLDKDTIYRAQKRESDIKDRLNPAFIGTWVVDGSSAQFKIDLLKGTVVFSGLDLDDSERFQISGISWDKTTFQGSVIMPSTMHETNIKLSVLDENRLRCEYIGDFAGEAIWRRK